MSTPFPDDEKQEEQVTQVLERRPDDRRPDGRVSRAQRLRQERRAQVQQVARGLFAERGYHETSIQDILDGAEIARGTFYQYFDSKRAIFAELVDEFLQGIQGVVTRVDLSPGADPPLRQIEQNVSRVMDILQKSRDLTRIMLRLAAGVDPETDAKMSDFYGRLLSLLQHAIENGQRMGLVRPCDPLVVSHAALGSLKEVLLQWIVHRDSTPDQLLHVGREILNFSLKGLFNHGGTFPSPVG